MKLASPQTITVAAAYWRWDRSSRTKDYPNEPLHFLALGDALREVAQAEAHRASTLHLALVDWGREEFGPAWIPAFVNAFHAAQIKALHEADRAARRRGAPSPEDLWKN